MQNTVYIGLGSNIEDRSKYLSQAIADLILHSEITLVNFSSIYETEPIGYIDQNSFLNMVIKVKTSLKPLDLLRVTQEVEYKNGRKRDIKWGPRTLDLDILLYNQENIETEKLIVPHPRMQERAFVLIPLIEIDKDIKIPYINTSVSFHIDQLPEREGVEIWKQKSGEDVFELFAN